MYRLKFINPETHEGINTTVRRGIKWANPQHTTLDIMTSDGRDRVAFAMVRETRVYRFCDIPEHVIALQHSAETQTYKGLKAAMHRAYDDFDENEIVTVVFFTVHH